MQGSCPDLETLRELALGFGDGRTFDDLARHVEECAACQQQLETLEQSADPLVGQLQRPRRQCTVNKLVTVYRCPSTSTT